MTNKIVLRTVDQYMGGFNPVYSPIWSLFLKNAVQYTAEVGKQNFREIQTVGDIRTKRITPKDTELKQIAVAEGTKTFLKYFDMNQFVQSSFQDQTGVEDIIRQVLDEHNRQADDRLLGDGTNSGLYTSTDVNYLLQSSYEVKKGSDSDYVADLYSKVLEQSILADQNDGEKMVMFYGALMTPKVSALFKTAVKPFKEVLSAGLPSNYRIAVMPSDIVPTGSPNGFMIINLDQIRLHWTAMPQLKARGLNEEKEYYWFNFLLGSMMVDVRVNKAIIRQPTTFEA